MGRELDRGGCRAGGQVCESGYSHETSSSRMLAGDACQGEELAETADQVEWREHSDGFEALGRVEVNVALEGIRYGGVNDEPHNGDSSFRRLGAAGVGRGPCRDTSCGACVFGNCRGLVEYFVFRNA